MGTKDGFGNEPTDVHNLKKKKIKKKIHRNHKIGQTRWYLKLFALCLVSGLGNGICHDNLFDGIALCKEEIQVP